MAIYHFTTKSLSRSSRNTVAAVAYRAGCQLEDIRTGEKFDYRYKDVERVELLLPKDAPSWIVQIQQFMKENRQQGTQALSDIAELAEKRIDARVWREFEFALHRELTDEQNIALAREFVEDQICGRGIAAQLNFHFDRDKETGEYKPHCHVLALTRQLTDEGLNLKKEREWNKKEILTELREQWAHYSNFHLKFHGHDVHINHRSYHELGIDIEPQPKQGKNVLEQEKKTQLLANKQSPTTDKAQAFHDVQLRNLYRILRRPETMLDIVTKHHTTFTWGDVEEVLHRYIEELALFQRMEVRLRKSSHLVTLHSEKENSPAIYTTKEMVKVELSLVEHAEKLAACKSHDIFPHTIEDTLKQASTHFTFSREQEGAIRHLVNDQQLSCIVGVAGSGKTTILGVSRDIWTSNGYKVYGLAPTGKAAQNLEQAGISSKTVHGFLKDFNSGRCHYNSQSVLVLDEAGMVDVKRFSKLLEAIEHLGTKLIVMGDGAQLQPVEAGPAFRLITERVGARKLSTVVRQKEDWQKEATILFGKQQTKEALERYEAKGKIHIIKESLPSLSTLISTKDYQGLVRFYEIANRSASLIYREMRKDIELSPIPSPKLISGHADFELYQTWKILEKESAVSILTESKNCKHFLEEQSLDPIRLAKSIVDKNIPQARQQEEIQNFLKSAGLKPQSHPIKPSSIDVRQEAKKALLKTWHTSLKETSDKSILMLAFGNRDVSDLNTQARFLLKTSGHLEKQEFLYKTKRQIEDDFGRKRVVVEEKGFSKGDRVVFTRNNYGLGVKNGTIGTILYLNQQNIKIRLENEKEISFAPKLNPFFDHGWAITIHKSQGTTVDKAYVLASANMNKNLTYVAMTRHREDVHVFGSSLDFWRPEKLPGMLAKSGEKLSAADYLNASTLQEFIQKEEHILTKIFSRISDELQAMGIVSKKAFERVVGKFLENSKQEDLRIKPEILSQPRLREEVRAEKVLQDKPQTDLSPSTLLPSLSKEKDQAAEGFLSSLKKALNLRNLVSSRPQAKSFQDIVKVCENRLHRVMLKEGNALTAERLQRFPLQAEKTASFLFHSHYMKGIEPSEKEISQASLRAKYELIRIPQIRNQILKGWQEEGRHKGGPGTPKENQGILAHMVAERLASIEGRLYLEAKQKGNPSPSNLLKLAQEELKDHRQQTPKLSEEWSQKYLLSKDAATSCAKHVLRYKEIHGSLPSNAQTDAIARISQELEHKIYRHPSKEFDHHEAEFLRRREEDMLLNAFTGRGQAISHSIDTAAIFKEMEGYIASSKALSSGFLSREQPHKNHEFPIESHPEKDHDYGPSL